MVNILNEFFNSKDFAETAIYYPSSSSGVTSKVQVIFDSEYSVNVLNNVKYQNATPTIICKTADIPNISTDSKFIVTAGTFYVLEVQTEDTGTTTLILSKDIPHGK